MLAPAPSGAAPAEQACLACGKAGHNLICCGRCSSAWFCNRECQIVARTDGHEGANCRPAEGVQASPSSATLEARTAAAVDVAKLVQSLNDLLRDALTAQRLNSRIGYLAAVEKLTEAGPVADRVGGEQGAIHRTHADKLLSNTLVSLGDLAAATRAACSSVRAARASGSRTTLVAALTACGAVANFSPVEMAKAESASREEERLSGSQSSLGGLDLSQEGWISLPTTPADLSRLSLAYNEAAVAICDAALEAAGGRGSPAAADTRRVPTLNDEAQARGSLGLCLGYLGEERERSFDLLRQAAALLRLVVRMAAPGGEAQAAKQVLAVELCNLGGLLAHGAGGMRIAPGSDEVAEAEACLREALELSQADQVSLQQTILRSLVNLSGQRGQSVDAEAFRSRLNLLDAQTGRSLETGCTICLEPLEPLEQPDGGTEEVDEGDGGGGDGGGGVGEGSDGGGGDGGGGLGGGGDGGDGDDGGGEGGGGEASGGEGGGGEGGGGDGVCEAVHVLACGHQFHSGCLSTWWCTTSNGGACPLCKK